LNQYVIISGTNRSDSNTLNIARYYQQVLEENGVTARLISLEGMDINKRTEVIQAMETSYLIPATRFIIVAPEYNGSFPGVLKAFIDQTDIKKVWWGKRALLTGVSTGRAGNLRGMEHLTGVLNYLKVVVHPNKLPISVVDQLLDDQKWVADPATQKAIAQQLEEFLTF
jgi:chromate reductase, NAD(P)H dehydrogenase (quinone)